MTSSTAILGGMTPATFLREHWQKKPLLVRQAFPSFGGGLIDRDGLFAVAAKPGAVSRVVVETTRKGRAKYALYDGGLVDPAKLPKSKWTLLVQGAEGFVDGAWGLLRAFSFIPLARVDDLMVSYAVDGGGVGPHDDLYDVFLLQGPGRRRWRVQTGGKRDYDTSQPVKIVRNFKADADGDVVLEPGDMLYVPPGVAHWGEAVGGPCFTYSIGCVAPSHEALVQNWLAFLSQRYVDDRRMYEDPQLQPTASPALIGDAMVDAVFELVRSVGRDRDDVEEFLGRLLTGPKPNVVFARPKKPSSFSVGAVIGLAKKSRGLVRGRRAFLNGEALVVDNPTLRLLDRLFTDRSMALPPLPDDVVAWLERAHAAGWIDVGR